MIGEDLQRWVDQMSIDAAIEKTYQSRDELESLIEADIAKLDEAYEASKRVYGMVCMDDIVRLHFETRAEMITRGAKLLADIDEKIAEFMREHGREV